MVEERIYVERHPGVNLLGALFVSLLVILGVMWAMGVMTVDKNGGQVVVTFDFSKAERASENAADKAGRALERAGEKLREKAGQDNERTIENQPAPIAPARPASAS